MVGDRANVFISFTYNTDYSELVDSVSRYLSEENLPPETTYFWFDLFVNDQWSALDMDFDWWGEFLSYTLSTCRWCPVDFVDDISLIIVPVYLWFPLSHNISRSGD